VGVAGNILDNNMNWYVKGVSENVRTVDTNQMCKQRNREYTANDLCYFLSPLSIADVELLRHRNAMVLIVARCRLILAAFCLAAPNRLNGA